MGGGRQVVVAWAMAAAIGGCSSVGTAAGVGNPSILTARELSSVAELNCYEAVQRLRPAWLRTRGRVSMTSQQGIRLYVDGIQRGYVQELVNIRANAVERMRYLSGREATARYGTDHTDGAVLVTLRTG